MSRHKGADPEAELYDDQAEEAEVEEGIYGVFDPEEKTVTFVDQDDRPVSQDRARQEGLNGWYDTQGNKLPPDFDPRAAMQEAAAETREARAIRPDQPAVPSRSGFGVRRLTAKLDEKHQVRLGLGKNRLWFGLVALAAGAGSWALLRLASYLEVLEVLAPVFYLTSTVVGAVALGFAFFLGSISAVFLGWTFKDKGQVGRYAVLALVVVLGAFAYLPIATVSGIEPATARLAVALPLAAVVALVTGDGLKSSRRFGMPDATRERLIALGIVMFLAAGSYYLASQKAAELPIEESIVPTEQEQEGPDDGKGKGNHKGKHEKDPKSNQDAA